MTPIKTAIALSCAACVLALLVPTSAHASCAPEDLAIVWAYPPNGATNVPVDADFFVLLNNSVRYPRVELNGEEVLAYPRGHYPLEELLPETEYVVRISDRFDMDSVPLETRFTTGSSTAPTTSTPILSGYSVDTYPFPASPQQCRPVLQAQGCFDTFQDAVVRLNATGDATFWLVESTGPAADGGGQPVVSVWPGDCGPPSIVYHRERIGMNPPCVRVTSVSQSGERRSSNEVCFDAPDAPGASSKGCSVDPSPSTSNAWGGVLAGAALLAVRRRRRM